MSAYDKARDAMAHTPWAKIWSHAAIGLSFPVVIEVGGYERECLCGCDEFRMGPGGVLLACNHCGKSWTTDDDPPPPKIEEITDW